MTEQPPGEETFRRPFFDRAVGCLVYMLLVPFIAVFLSIFIMLPVQALGASESVVFALFYGSFFVFLIGFAIRGYREFRERANIGVRVQGDRIVSWAGSRVQEFEFSDVRS